LKTDRSRTKSKAREEYLRRFAERSYFMQGDESVAYGSLYAGCDFFAGYPITPASEVAEVMAAELPHVDGHYIQMEDELASLSAVIGAVWAGAKGMTATSGPGFSLMQENIGYAVMTETPCVIVNVQRSGPSTGQATMPAQGDVLQARWGTHGDHDIIALAPNSVQECFELAIEAFNLAERFRVPVILLGDEAIGHLMENVQIPKVIDVFHRKKTKRRVPPFGDGGEDLVPPMPAFGEGAHLLVTGSTHDPWGFRQTEDPEVHAKLVERINKKILQARETITQNDSYFLENADLAVVAYGFTSRSALYAVKKLREEGHSLGLLRLKTLWPFPVQLIKTLESSVNKIFVPEMNQGQIAGEILKHTKAHVISICQTNGEIIHPHSIMDEIRRCV